MKKYLITAMVLGAGISVVAQVGLSTAAPAATLDINAIKTDGTTSEGIKIPSLTGNQIKNAGAQYTLAQTGTMVYATSIPTSADTKTANITAAGCYYFDGSVWRSLGKRVNNTVVSYSTNVDPNILGYVPSKTSSAASSAPASLTIGSGVYTRQGTVAYSVNGHSYAAYSGDTQINWFDAYTAAKNMGGYLATYTSDAEWKYIEQNLLDNNTIFNTQKTWMGFVKFSWGAGPALTPDPEAKWITGEQPVHDYTSGGTSAVKKVNWFAQGEPNNSNSNEGFIHTYGKNDGQTITFNGYTSAHPWNDYPANNGVTGFIVEFQQ